MKGLKKDVILENWRTPVIVDCMEVKGRGQSVRSRYILV